MPGMKGVPQERVGAKKVHLNGKAARRRVCLRCTRTFMSEGPWHRICPTCQRREDAAITPGAARGRVDASLEKEKQ